MVAITPDIPDKRFVISQIGTVYDSAAEALKEYSSNSIDNVAMFGYPSINVYFLHDNRWKNPQTGTKEPRMIIMDDGPGMTWRHFTNLPRNTGTSDKRGMFGAIGNKGFGIWAYGAINKNGTDMRMYTRYHTNDPTLTEPTLYSAVQKLGEQWGARIQNRRSAGSKVYYVCEYPTMVKLERNVDPDARVIIEEQLNPHIRNFDHGTMVVITNIPEGTMRHLTRALPGQLSEMYDPLIREKKARIHTGPLGGQLRTVNPLTYTGDVLIDTELEVPYENKRGEAAQGKLRVYILRSDTKSSRVRLYENGVYVTLLPRTSFHFNAEPWTSPELVGYIASDFLDLKAGRSQLEVDDNFHNFVDVLKREVEPEVKSGLRRFQVVRKPRDRVSELTDEFLKGLFEVLPGWERRYGLGGGGYVAGTKSDATADVVPGRRAIEDDSTKRGSGSGGKAGGGSGKGSGRTTKPPTSGGGSTTVTPTKGSEDDTTDRRGQEGYELGEDGMGRRVRPARLITPFIVEREAFKGAELRIKSRLDYYPEERGIPRIYINTAHPSRKEKEELGEESLLIYDAHLISSEAAIAEVRKFCHSFQAAPAVLAQHLSTIPPGLSSDFFNAGLGRVKLKVS